MTRRAASWALEPTTQSGKPSDGCNPTTSAPAFRWLRHIVELEVPGAREDKGAYEPLAGERRRLLQSSSCARRHSAADGSSWSGGMTEHALVDEHLRLESTVLRRAAAVLALVRRRTG